MKNDVRYLGSVRFYKHLILFITASLILLPTTGLIFILVRYWALKQNTDFTANELQLCIKQLEEKLAFYEEQWEERYSDIRITTNEAEKDQEIPAEQEITDEDILVVPFSVDMEEIKYILVNDSHPLPQTYTPELVETRNGKYVHKEIKEFLEQMIDDAKEEGLDILICSSYRDYEKQAKLVEESVESYMNQGYDYQEAFFKAKCYLAMVGRSEHHTGLAVDLVGVAYQVLDEGQANTPESKWLKENAHRYGFILRYPLDKEEITGILYESWHFRYVGEEAAFFIKENNLCLEEFLDLVYRQYEKK